MGSKNTLRAVFSLCQLTCGGTVSTHLSPQEGLQLILLGKRKPQRLWDLRESCDHQYPVLKTASDR